MANCDSPRGHSPVMRKNWDSDSSMVQLLPAMGPPKVVGVSPAPSTGITPSTKKPPSAAATPSTARISSTRLSGTDGAVASVMSPKGSAPRTVKSFPVLMSAARSSNVERSESAVTKAAVTKATPTTTASAVKAKRILFASTDLRARRSILAAYRGVVGSDRSRVRRRARSCARGWSRAWGSASSLTILPSTRNTTRSA